MSDIITLLLLLGVVTTSAFFFNNWYMNFESNILSNVENTVNAESMSIEGIADNKLYVKNGVLNGSINNIKIVDNKGVEVCKLNNLYEDIFNKYNDNIIARWKFDDNNSVIKDYSNNGNNGVLYGNTKFLMSFDGDLTDETSYDNDIKLYGDENTVLLMNFDDDIKDKTNNHNDGILYDDTVLLMNFDGGTANDLSSKNIDGTLSGGVNCNANGFNGKGCEFDGVNGYINTGSTLNNLEVPFAISLWVNPADSQVIYNDIIGNHNDVYKGFVIQQNGNNLNQYTFGYGDGSQWSENSGPVQLETNKWQNILVQTDGSKCYFYVNGILKSSGNCLPNLAVNTGMNVKIAQGYHTGRFFKGSIDEVMVYNRFLNIDEIQTLYDSKKAKFESNLADGIDDNGIELLDKNYVEVGNLNFNEKEGVTYSLWYKLTDDMYDGRSRHEGLFGIGGGNWNPYKMLHGYLGVNNTIKLILSDYEGSLDNYYYLTVNDTKHINKSWNHVTITLKNIGGLTNIRIYSNGELIYSEDRAGTFVADITDRPYIIGGNYWNLYPDNKAGFSYFNGSIDEVGIYKKVLTANEVKYLYDSKKTKFSNNLIEGMSKTGMKFDGVDDYVEVSDVSNFEFRNQSLTYSTWINVKRNNNIYGGIISLGDALDNYPSIDLAKSRSGFWDGRVYFQLGMPDSEGVVVKKSLTSNLNGDALTDAQWIHFVGIVDKENNQIKLYRNGILENFTDYLSYDLSSASNLKLRVGGLISDGIYSFNGSIDEVAIYSKALTDTEVLDLYNYQKAKFVEFTNDGLEFDGIDDYVSFNSLSDFLRGLKNVSVFVSLENDNKDNENILNNDGASIFQSNIDNEGSLGIYQGIYQDSLKIYLRGKATDSAQSILASNVVDYNTKIDLLTSYDFANKNIKIFKNNGLVLNENIAVGLNNFYNPDNFITNKDNIGFTPNSNYFKGKISEVAVFNTSIDTNNSKIRTDNLQKGINKIDISSCKLEKDKAYNVIMQGQDFIKEKKVVYR